jgi:menaquinone-dependent protoporphyrinogen oxidase
MNILVVSASRHGSTTEIAGSIGSVLRGRGFDVTVAAAEQAPAPAAFDAVVLGSAVYAGRWLKSAVRFVETNAATLRTRDVWLFSSGPLGDPPKPDEELAAAASMIETTGAHEHRVFAGALDPCSLNLVEKAVVKAVHAPYGDFRSSSAITAWADSIADVLQSKASEPLIRQT